MPFHESLGLLQPVHKHEKTTPKEEGVPIVRLCTNEECRSFETRQALLSISSNTDYVKKSFDRQDVLSPYKNIKSG